jgi:hypothetical protein
MVYSVCDRNEYQEYLVGGRGGRCVGLTTLPLSCSDFREIREAQARGTLIACTRFALLFIAKQQNDQCLSERTLEMSSASFSTAPLAPPAHYATVLRYVCVIHSISLLCSLVFYIKGSL